jgi:ABC-2 type transport system permease protein
VNIIIYGFIGAIRYRLGFGRAFVYEIIASLAWFAIDAAGFWVILTRFGSIGGWSTPEVFLLFAVGGVVSGIGSGFFWRGNSAVGWMIETGYIDLLLTKPVDPYASFVSGNVNPAHMPKLLVSIGFMIYCIRLIPVPVPFFKMVMFVIGIIGGMLLCAAMATAGGALGWRIPRGENSMNIVSTLSRVTQYPMHIYPRVLQAISTFVLPFALTNYYPTRYLIRGDVPGGAWLMAGTFVLGAALFYGAYRLWLAGLRHYQGTGS